MKNIAIPLLMASSARAQDRKSDLMKQDKAVPKPILIADDWHDGDCVDAAGDVAAKYSALIAAEEKLQEATGLRAALVEAVDEAAEAKTEAVVAVVEQDTSMAEALEADDAAQTAERTKKAALDQANIDEAAAILAAEVALEVKEAADLALEEAQEIKSAMDTALEEATAHEEHEQGQTETWEGKVTGAEEDYETKEEAAEELLGLYNDEVAEYTPKQTTTDEKKALWDDYLSLTSKLLSDYTTSEGEIDAGTVGTPAEIKAAEENTLTTVELAELNTEAGNWETLAQTTVKKLFTWINVSPETYTTRGANEFCAGANEISTAVTDNTSVDDCQEHCNAKLAWKGTTNLPVKTADQTSYDSGTPANSTICYGIAWKTGQDCKWYPDAKITAATGTANDSTNDGYQCYSRDKSTVGEEVGAAVFASHTDEAEYELAFVTKLNAWGTQTDVVTDAVQAYDLANDYSVKIGEAKETAETARNTYEGEYNEAYIASEESKEEMDTAEEDYNNKVAEVATALSTLTSYQASLSTQEDEETAQDALVTIATDDVAAQEETVEGLETVAEELDGLNSDAITNEEEATEARETAEEEYDAAVESAEGTEEALVTPLETLAGLRSTAVERTEDLVAALGNESAQEAAIAEEQNLVDEASEAHLASILECKEARYDQYAETLVGEEGKRAADLSDIEDLIDDNPAPAAGTIGARCEKAVSNGTFRPKRDVETCTGETVCCGASKIAQGNLIMTIETCQNEGTTEYTYVPPRGPMETTMPTGTKHPFACIDGAQKLAAATSALAAAVYMLA